MSCGRICVREVDVAEPGESVQVVAQRMHDRNVGMLVVVDRLNRPIGLVTDRDLVTRALARSRDPIQTLVEEVMSKPVATVCENTPIEEGLRIMRSGPFRRVPVVDS